MSYDYFPVQDSLQTSINVTLEQFINAFLKNKDYDSVLLMAEIGKKTTVFVNELFDQIHDAEANIIAVQPVEVAIAEEVVEAVEVEVVNTKPINPRVSKPKRRASSPRVNNSPEVYGVSRQETKDWIFNYIGARGGRAHQDDVYEDYYKQNLHRFNEHDLAFKNGKANWKQNVTHRVEAMRKDTTIHIPLLEPVGKGSESKYYVMTANAYADYKRKASEQQRFNFNDEDGLTLGA